MVRYMKCPRCELNYIDAEKQEYCDVCMKELKGIPTDLDDIEEVEEAPAELCPICGENIIRQGEKMCDECRRKNGYEAEEPDPEDDDDEWRNYLDDDTDDELDSEIGEIDEAFEGEFDEEELEEEDEEDFAEEEEDLEYVTGDEIYTLTDDEDEDEEDFGDDF